MSEIKFYTRFSIGDKVYTTKQVNAREECPYCKGDGVIYIDEKEMECPNCNHKGYIEYSRRKMQVVCEDIATIKSIKAKITQDGITYRYEVETSTARYKRGNEALFLTKEDAERYCEIINKPKRQMLLDDIIITGSFKSSKPDVAKIQEKLEYYKTHNKFDSKIIINDDNVLIDGYITYLIARMIGKSVIECWVEN